MATGDPTDIQSRLRALTPANWFPIGETPIFDAILAGVAAPLAYIYSLVTYAKKQTRIATASDGFLDLIAGDFFSDKLLRLPQETDVAYRARIIASIFRERNTRNAVVQIVTQITGQPPVIFEPLRAADTGGYGAPFLAYGVSGGYGSRLLQNQAFVTAYRPNEGGIPNIAGYNIPTGAYNTGSQAEYASLSMIDSIVTDASIYAAIESVRPTCAILWVLITNKPVTSALLASPRVPIIDGNGDFIEV